MKIKGYVELVLRDLEGNEIARSGGPNTVVKMSNNIIMDALFPKLGSIGVPTAYPVRPAGPNMTEDTAYPSGAYFIGSNDITQSSFVRNQIAYIGVGSNIGFDSAGNPHGALDQNNDVAAPAEQYSMVDSGFDLVSSTYARKIDSVEFPSDNQIKYVTTFTVTEGNIASGIAEVGLWTNGDNADMDGFVTTATTTTNCRMFARKVLSPTITKTALNTLEISYTLTLGA